MLKLKKMFFNFYKKIKEMKTKNKIKTILIAIVIIFILAKVFPMFSESNDTVVVNKYTVKNGDIAVSLSGSATVEPIEEYSVVSLVKGEILEDYITEGQEIKEGDILYRIDSKDAENNILKAQNSYEKSKLSYDENLEKVQNLTVYSPMDGVISNLYVEKGDSLNSNSKIADVIDYTNLTVRLPFIVEQAQNMYEGQHATVILSSSGLRIDGVVKKVYSGEYTRETGALVSDVDISFINPGALVEGELVTALVGDYACNKAGEIEYKNKYNIVAKSSGDIETLNFKQGDKIKQGEILLTLKNTSLLVSTKSSSLSLQDSQLNIQDMYSELDNYTITSPISGKVIQKNYKAGDTIDGTNNKENLAVIADMSKLRFTLNIDELDISNVKVGQKAIITVDALPNKVFEGEIENISILGTTSNGTTSYPVDIIISEYEGLIPGMSINADIITQEAKDVLTVPISAIQRGNKILVNRNSVTSKATNEKVNNGGASIKTNSNKKDDAESVTPDAKDKEKKNTRNMESPVPGFEYVTVTTGVTDDSFVEITSGLNEGDEIAYITVNATKTNTTQNNNSQVSGIPIGGGMMPSGNMPMGGGRVQGNSRNGNATQRN